MFLFSYEEWKILLLNLKKFEIQLKNLYPWLRELKKVQCKVSERTNGLRSKEDMSNSFGFPQNYTMQKFKNQILTDIKNVFWWILKKRCKNLFKCWKFI